MSTNSSRYSKEYYQNNKVRHYAIQVRFWAKQLKNLGYTVVEPEKDPLKELVEMEERTRPAKPGITPLMEARLRTKMTRRELAEKVGVTYPTVRSWELGRTNPGGYVIDSLASELGLSLSELISILPNGGRTRHNGSKKATVW